MGAGPFFVIWSKILKKDKNIQLCDRAVTDGCYSEIKMSFGRRPGEGGRRDAEREKRAQPYRELYSGGVLAISLLPGAVFAEPAGESLAIARRAGASGCGAYGEARQP